MVARTQLTRKLAKRASLRVLFLCLAVICCTALVRYAQRVANSTASRGESPVVSKPTLSLDLNSATAAQLQALPTVGPSLAARIVNWREEHGPFASIDDLQNVHGVGEATIARIGPLLSVEVIQSQPDATKRNAKAQQRKANANR